MVVALLIQMSIKKLVKRTNCLSCNASEKGRFQKAFLTMLLFFYTKSVLDAYSTSHILWSSWTTTYISRRYLGGSGCRWASQVTFNAALKVRCILQISSMILRMCAVKTFSCRTALFFFFFLRFSYFTSLREQVKAYINSSRWSMLVGLEHAYICMWVARSTTVLRTPTTAVYVCVTNLNEFKGLKTSFLE